jgi:uridine kinase
MKMTVLMDNQRIESAKGARYADLVARLYPQQPRRALGVRVNGRTLSLGEPAEAGAHVMTLPYTVEEGARIYERSLRFTLLLAIRELFPRARVRMENSTQTGLYARLVDVNLTASMVRKIEQRMRALVDADLPFEKKVITRSEAIRYFEREGQTDKVRLLKYRPFEHFQLYKCGDMLEYFYGEMPPSTGYTPVFKLDFYMPGIALSLPDPDDPSRPAQFRDQPKLMRCFEESTRWAKILGCENAADLNEMILERKLREFIRVNEALHERAVNQVADEFLQSGARLILVAGPSSSGKTTFAHRLSIALKVRGLNPYKLSLDDYYLDRDKIPPGDDGEVDLERLDTLDLPLFNEHLVRLMQGETVEAPVFDFPTGRRLDSRHKVRIDRGAPILIEGIHALNDELTCEVPHNNKFLIYVSALTTLNLDDHNRIRTTDARLLRRMVRDYNFRGTMPEETLSMWPSVRRGEANYIFPHQEKADVMVNTSLTYELPILKKYAYPLLLKVPPESPHFTRARSLVKFLNYIQTADVEDEIPPNSILREFIGGSCFYRQTD